MWNRNQQIRKLGGKIISTLLEESENQYWEREEAAETVLGLQP